MARLEGGGGDVTLERIGEVHRRGDFVRGMPIPCMRVALDRLGERQGESVAIDANETLYLASEDRPWSDGGSLMALRCRMPD